MNNFEKHNACDLPSVERHRAADIVSLLNGPVFVDMRPGHVRVDCQGFTGIGPDRVSAFQALADQVQVAATS